jgi:hypothetical protein
VSDSTSTTSTTVDLGGSIIIVDLTQSGGTAP